jgi:acyl-CoA thioester hydrolase
VAAVDRAPPTTRDAYVRFTSLTLRWNDLDAFGHVNNVQFYSWFDTAIVSFLVEIGAFDISGGEVMAMIAESGARFHSEVHFTDTVTVGTAVRTIGRSSVRYGIGVFVNDEATAAVDGFFVHVFANRATRRPIEIPQHVRTAFEGVLREVGP